MNGSPALWFPGFTLRTTIRNLEDGGRLVEEEPRRAVVSFIVVNGPTSSIYVFPGEQPSATIGFPIYQASFEGDPVLTPVTFTFQEHLYLAQSSWYHTSGESGTVAIIEVLYDAGELSRFYSERPE